MTGSEATATIDRFEGPEKEVAVLIEDTGGTEGSRPGTGVKVDVDRSLLPEGAEEGDVILLSCSLGEGDEETVRVALKDACLDRQATDARQKRVEDRLERLKGGEHREGSRGGEGRE
ncbi:DUF3006 domain-containing protein [Rubrobacter aplysinae]|uniref:DUF3006 domain-containing protein n=1 Tax=Rubrobacter aplysinae TaxID=909625 RepID=UPI00064C2C88|nr:DUF3006 domain-containing protein [Rubrobacter aplysinae]